jgi:hypothetical protein
MSEHWGTYRPCDLAVESVSNAGLRPPVPKYTDRNKGSCQARRGSTPGTILLWLKACPVTRPRTNRVALTTGHDLSWMGQCMKRVSVSRCCTYSGAVQASLPGQIRSDRWPKAGWLRISRRIIPCCPQIFRSMHWQTALDIHMLSQRCFQD